MELPFMPITSYREYGVYTVCKRRCAALGIEFGFASGEQFFAEVGRRPSKTHRIARINPDGPFGPGNVTWITAAEKKARTKVQQRERQERKRARTAAKHAFFAAHRVEQRHYYAIRHRCKAKGVEFLFGSFEQFCAEIGPRPSPEHELKRIDVFGHYCAGNVRWTTRKQPRTESQCERARKLRRVRDHRNHDRRLALYAAKHRTRQLAREQERQEREQARACAREHKQQQRERERVARKAYKVYVLIDPITGKVKYVGHTSETLFDRLQGHRGKQPNDRCQRKTEWIATLKAHGFRPFVLMLHSCATKGEALKFERQEIEQFRAEGCDLLNGNLPMTPELAWRIYDLRMMGTAWKTIAELTRVSQTECWHMFARMTVMPSWMKRYGYAPYTEPRPVPSNTSNQIVEITQ
jgi:hypothetical protein